MNNANEWTFPVIFKDIDTKMNFVRYILECFQDFPSETKLNCDDYSSIMSLICPDFPYSFIVFVLECVDPSISSGRLLTHRVAFGNFLLALPCCILYPFFMHEVLTLYKGIDILRNGIITRDKFLLLLNQVLKRFIHHVEEEDEEDEKVESLVCEVNGHEKRYPNPSLYEDYFEATIDLEKSSIQTLFFVMWQTNDLLLKCKESNQNLNISEIKEPEPSILENESS